MWKMNEKGFLLIETLVVTVFVVSIFIFIYSNTIPLIGKYEQRFKYDDLDSVYAADLVRNMILNTKTDAQINAIIPVDTASAGTNHIKQITCASLYTGQPGNLNFCNNLVSELHIDQMYLTHYNLHAVKEDEQGFFNDSKNRGLHEYVKYLPKFQNIILTKQHRVIIVRKVEEFGRSYTRYANIELIHGE